MSALKVISLYTGAGGLDYGFEAAGFRTSVALEMDAASCATLRANRRWPVIEADILDVPAESLLATGHLEAGAADVLIGGPPCQPFSKSGFWATGATKRLDDPRASTIEQFFRVLEDTKPRAFLFENVEGLGFRGRDEGLHFIHKRLDAINHRTGTSYSATTAVLNAADYGVPQMRRRLFVVGAKDGTPFRFPQPTHADPDAEYERSLLPYATTWQAFRGLPTLPPENLSLTGKWADLLPSIPEGFNYLWHTERGGGEPLFGWRTRYWCFLLKLAKHRPSWTLQAQPGPATGPFHWKNRRLSRQEMGRLQTFPDDVIVEGNIAVAQKQIGNAVPSLLAEILAREIRSQLLHRPSRTALRLVVPPACGTAREEVVKPVPEKYLALRGKHRAHPGTGFGPRASRRAMEEVGGF